MAPSLGDDPDGGFAKPRRPGFIFAAAGNFCPPRRSDLLIRPAGQDRSAAPAQAAWAGGARSP